jgi:hypothetical protein
MRVLTMREQYFVSEGKIGNVIYFEVKKNRLEIYTLVVVYSD